MLRMEVLEEFRFEPTNIFDGNGVKVAVASKVDRHHLVFHSLRVVLRLLQQLNEARSALQLCLGGIVEVRRESSECFQVAVCGEVNTQRTRNLLHTLCLGGTTDTGDRHTDVNSGANALVEEV